MCDKVILCRAREMNGISYLSRMFSKTDPNVIWADSVFSFILIIVSNRRKIRSIIAMSDIEAIIAVCFTNILRMKVPILVGVFHPMQWHATLNSNISKRKVKVLNRFLDSLEPSNVLVTSSATINSCASFRLKFQNGCHKLIGPISLPGNENVIHRNLKHSVVTVGRYVDFKVSTILAMINTIESLLAIGWDIEYHIYGDGPSRQKIIDRITNSEYFGKFHVHGLLPLEDFREVVSKHTVFFGMGTALYQAAMSGIPAIIAIQGETDSTCYGLLTDHDHNIEPVFGDPSPFIKICNLESVLTYVLNLNLQEWVKLAENSRKICVPYSATRSIESLNSAVNNAVWLSNSKVTLFDLLIIRLQSIWSKLIKRNYLHT